MLKFLTCRFLLELFSNNQTGNTEMRLSSFVFGSATLLSIFSNSHVDASDGISFSVNSCGGYVQSSSTTCDSALGEHVYNLVNDGVYSGISAIDSYINVAGINISVSSWADTYGKLDDLVVSADNYKISNHYGYGVTNQDWEYSHSYPDHAIDNVNTVRGNWQDFDFVLFSFNESVTLQGASFSWVYNQKDTQVSVAALENLDALTSGSNTWDDIVSNAITSSYSVKKTNSSNAHLNYKSEFALSTTAKYWLIGAYNKVFGNIGGSSSNDAFKLTNIGFSIDNDQPNSNVAEVSEPATLGLLFASGLLVMWRRKTTR